MKNLDPKARLLFFIQHIIGWLVFSGFGSFWLFGLMTGLNEASTVSASTIVWLSLGLFVAIVLLAWLTSWLTYINYHYELGENGFQKESGVIYKKYVTIPYSRIQNVDIYRGIFARIFNLSDIRIQTAGSSLNTITSEGMLPAIHKDEAIKIRDELMKRVNRPASPQGL